MGFMLVRKEHWLFLRNVNAIPGEFQHALVVVDMDKKKMSKVVR